MIKSWNFSKISVKLFRSVWSPAFELKSSVQDLARLKSTAELQSFQIIPASFCERIFYRTTTITTIPGESYPSRTIMNHHWLIVVSWKRMINLIQATSVQYANGPTILIESFYGLQIIMRSYTQCCAIFVRGRSRPNISPRRFPHNTLS